MEDKEKEASTVEEEQEKRNTLFSVLFKIALQPRRAEAALVRAHVRCLLFGGAISAFSERSLSADARE